MKEAIIQELTRALEKNRSVVFAYLFGSSAKDDPPSPAADIDVAAYIAADADAYESRLDIYGALSRSLGRNDIDVLMLNNARNLIILDEIVRRGIVLIDRDPDLRAAYEVRIMHLAIDFKTQRRKAMGI